MGTELGKYVARYFLRPISRADIDGNRKLTAYDMTAFTAAYAAGEVAADVDGNGVLDMLDIGRFTMLFAKGSPR